jgi:hypothetical protein
MEGDVRMQIISLEGLQVHRDGPGSGWSAFIAVDGVPVMEIAGGPDGGFEPVPGDEEDDAVVLGLLDEFVASTGEPVERDDGSLRPETLDDRVASLVAVGWIIRRVSDMLSTSVVAVADGSLVEVEVPEDGSLYGAMAHVRRLHPDAVLLNDLPIEEAAVEYMRLT